MLCLVAATALLWPLPLRLHTHTIDTGDALHLAWVVRWAQATLLGEAPPFSAPAGYPHAAMLLLNPPLYAMALLGLPLHLAGWSASAVYNALTILSFALAAWAAALLGREVSGSPGAGLLAGLGFAFSDVRLAHLAHLNLLSGFWTALLLGLIVRAWRRPPHTRRGQAALAVSAGLLAAAQALSDVYNALFMVVAVGCVGGAWAVTSVWRALSRRPEPRVVAAFTALAGGALLALVLVAPVLGPTLRTWHDLGVVRPWADHVRYAAAPEHYVMPQHERPLYDLKPLQSSEVQADPTEQRLWPGALTLLLALIGLIGGRGRLRWVFGLLALVALALSFGPTLRLGDRTIALPYYAWLFEHAPLFSAARVPARWALLLQLGLAVLSAVGLARLAGQRGRAVRLVGFGVIGALLLLDIRPTSVPTTSQIVGEPAPAVYRALAELPPGAVLEWPLENASPTLMHRSQFYTLMHGKPLVNSAASAPPDHYVDLIATLRSFPNTTATRVLADLGVRYVVVNRWEIGTWDALVPQLDAAAGIKLIGEYDDGRHRLYAVNRVQPVAPAPVATLSTTGHELRLTLQLAAPIWLAPPAAFYNGNAEQPVTFRDPNGNATTVRLLLAPVLLPGVHQFAVPAASATATTISLGGQAIRITPMIAPASGRSQPTLYTGPLPQRIAPGETLPCLVQTDQPLPAGLVLAATLIDGAWNEQAKHDHHPQATEGPFPCNVAIPTRLPPGDYFLAVGLYDPAQGAFVPVSGSDGVVTPGFWRVPQVIQVGM